MDVPLRLAIGQIASPMQKAQGCDALGLPIPACTSVVPATAIQFTGCGLLHSIVDSTDQYLSPVKA